MSCRGPRSSHSRRCCRVGSDVLRLRRALITSSARKQTARWGPPWCFVSRCTSPTMPFSVTSTASTGSLGTPPSEICKACTRPGAGVEADIAGGYRGRAGSQRGVTRRWCDGLALVLGKEVEDDLPGVDVPADRSDCEARQVLRAARPGMTAALNAIEHDGRRARPALDNDARTIPSGPCRGAACAGRPAGIRCGDTTMPRLHRWTGWPRASFRGRARGRRHRERAGPSFR